MNSDERDLDELLGAYALDAVSEEEARAVEEYLLVNPRARAEVAEHRETATMLAWTGAAAPEGLWDRIAASLDEAPPAPSGELAAVLALDPTRRAAAPGRPRRRSVARTLGAWAAASAAAAAVAVVAVSLLDDDATDAPLEAAVARARDDRDSIVVELVSVVDGTPGGEAIIDQDGHGFLIATGLPTLPDDRTYQLWGVIDGNAISLGILGHNPEVELFTVNGPVAQLVVTNEVAGGVVSNGNPDGAYAATTA